MNSIKIYLKKKKKKKTLDIWVIQMIFLAVLTFNFM